MLPNYLYWILYVSMLVIFLTLSLTSMPTPKEKLIGVLITMLNALIYYKG